MKVLGFINPFDELADPDQRLGRKVANHGLTAALLEYSSADELHFFLPFQSAAGPFERVYRPWMGENRENRRAKLIPAVRLPEAIGRYSYQAVHAAELDRYFPELCHLRNRSSGDPFPVTCTTHTLSYWHTQVRNLYKVLPGPSPCDSIFCTSRAARAHLQAAFSESASRLKGLGLQGAGYGGRFDIAPLGVRAADFFGPPRAKAQAGLGLEPGVLTLLFMGRLTPSDKADLAPLVGLLPFLNRKRPVRLMLAGAGGAAYGQELAQKAADMGAPDMVRLFPDFDSAQKADLYAAADILVSPSDNLQETFGLTIIEAMAAGLPVVASDFSGYRDLVAHGKTGFLIPAIGPSDFGDLDQAWPVLAERVAALQASQLTAVDLGAMLEALETLLGNAALRQEMGLAGRARVLEKFDWPVVIRGMEGIWAELKAQALSMDWPRPDVDVLGAGQGRVFGGHFSGLISDGDVLAPGPLAPAMAEGTWEIDPHPDLAGRIDPHALSRLMLQMAAHGGALSLARLKELESGRQEAAQVEHLALYGLKYGVFTIIEG